MYHFGPHEAMHAQGGPFGDPSQAATINYSDMGLGRSSSNSNSGNLEEKLRLLGFSQGDHQCIHVHDPCSGVKDELRCQLELTHVSLMQGPCYSPTNVSDTPFSMLNQEPINFGSAPADVPLGDLLPEAVGAATDTVAVYYDPQVQFDLMGQPPMVREMLSSMQQGGADQFIPGFSCAGSYFGLDHAAGYVDEACKQNSTKRKRRVIMEEKEDGEGLKNEKERRERFGKKFIDLRSLIPNATKNDRASILADTIDYINELLRTVKELKILAEKKRLRRLRGTKRPAAAAGGGEVEADMEDSSLVPFAEDSDHRPLKEMLRSSWLQRRSKDTSIDVRIVEDEVYIKLTQRRRANCLLVLSSVLEDLHLELLHLSGGNIGDSHIFMFNTKIHEGHPVYASAIAEKLIEVMGSSTDVPISAC